MASWDYDRIQGIKDGSVQVEGCDITHIVARPEETFFRLFNYQEFDVSEMSFAFYILGRTNIDFGYIALPIPLSRVFVHSGVFIRSDRGIKEPQDLKGKRVGVPSYRQTRGLCIRGMLSDEYGVKPTDVHWRIGGLDRPEFLQFVPEDVPRISKLNPSRPGARSLRCSWKVKSMLFLRRRHRNAGGTRPPTLRDSSRIIAPLSWRTTKRPVSSRSCILLESGAALRKNIPACRAR